MLPSSGKICSFVWTRVLIQLCIFCGLYFDCIQIQSFSGHFNFLHLSTLPRSDFPGSQGAKQRYRLVLFRWVRAKFLVFYVFFYGVCKPCNEPETSGDWTHKYHKAALLLITLSLYWTFLYLLYLLSLYIGIFSVICLFWENATTHTTETQIVRAKMRSPEAIFCRGNKSSSRSLSRFCDRKHKKSTARASRSWKKIELEL